MLSAVNRNEMVFEGWAIHGWYVLETCDIESHLPVENYASKSVFVILFCVQYLVPLN